MTRTRNSKTRSKQLVILRKNHVERSPKFKPLMPIRLNLILTKNTESRLVPRLTSKATRSDMQQELVAWDKGLTEGKTVTAYNKTTAARAQPQTRQHKQRLLTKKRNTVLFHRTTIHFTTR